MPNNFYIESPNDFFSVGSGAASQLISDFIILSSLRRPTSPPRTSTPLQGGWSVRLTKPLLKPNMQEESPLATAR